MRKFDPGAQAKFEIKLSPRQMDLRSFSSENEYSFFPQKIRSALKYKDFPIQRGTKILYEENILEKYLEHGRISVSDVNLTEGASLSATGEMQITLVPMRNQEWVRQSL